MIATIKAKTGDYGPEHEDLLELIKADEDFDNAHIIKVAQKIADAKAAEELALK